MCITKYNTIYITIYSLIVSYIYILLYIYYYSSKTCGSMRLLAGPVGPAIGWPMTGNFPHCNGLSTDGLHGYPRRQMPCSSWLKPIIRVDHSRRQPSYVIPRFLQDYILCPSQVSTISGQCPHQSLHHTQVAVRRR